MKELYRKVFRLKKLEFTPRWVLILDYFMRVRFFCKVDGFWCIETPPFFVNCRRFPLDKSILKHHIIYRKIFNN